MEHAASILTVLCLTLKLLLVTGQVVIVLVKIVRTALRRSQRRTR